MNRRLALTLFLIVFLPLALLLWMGQRVARTEAESFERFLQEDLDEWGAYRLNEIEERIEAYLNDLEREFSRLTRALQRDTGDLRALRRSRSDVACFFWVDSEGELVYPASAKGRPLLSYEKEFLDRTELIWDDRLLIRAGETEEGFTSPQSGLTSGDPPRTLGLTDRINPDAPSKQSGATGWYPWHEGHGLHLIFWRRLPSGDVVGLELERVRFMADLISILPDEVWEEGEHVIRTRESMALVSADKEPIYEWNNSSWHRANAPGFFPRKLQRTLPSPLSAWSLLWQGEWTSGQVIFASNRMGFYLGVAALGIGLCILVIYFYRESTRELREAGQRVNFVGQVSHELKTPLTNIRMYAELLENEIDEDNSEARKDLDVIVSESRRLSRLIGNILTFSRKDRGGLKLRPTPGDLDEAVRDTVEHFRPLLESKGVAISLQLNAAGEVPFDRDVVEQIVGNLLSNVEKYAASGQKLSIATRREAGRSTITVADEGPGVPRTEREKIFEPFYRVSDRLTDGVAGTGLGLSLSRELARLHFGDLKLLESESGATFEVTLVHDTRMEAPLT